MHEEYNHLVLGDNESQLKQPLKSSALSYLKIHILATFLSGLLLSQLVISFFLYRQSQDISHLKSNQMELQLKCQVIMSQHSAKSEEHSIPHAEQNRTLSGRKEENDTLYLITPVNQSTNDSNQQLSALNILARKKRAANRRSMLDSESDAGSGDGTVPSVQGNKKEHRKKKKSNRTATHFVAHVDMERIARLQAQGLESDLGNFTNNGFLPKEQTYRFWKQTNWSDTATFRYDHQTGKVKVKKAGLYLLYGQIMYHGPSARKSFAIHINDDHKPFIESMSFDVFPYEMHARKKRSIDNSESQRLLSSIINKYDDISSQHSALNENISGLPGRNDDISDTPKGRSKRSTDYASYNQCNTLAVTYLKKNSEVFIKSLERGRTIIIQQALTFWGIAKL